MSRRTAVGLAAIAASVLFLPACYAWQVDGATFSEIVVVRMLAKLEP